MKGPELVMQATKILRRQPSYVEQGRVSRVTDVMIEGHVRGAQIGSVVQIEAGDEWVPGEVVGFRGSAVMIVAESYTRGIAPGACIRNTNRTAEVGVGPGLFGRVISPSLEPLDGGPKIRVSSYAPLHCAPPPVHKRARITESFSTGVRVIDGLLTCGRGQRIGLFAGAGVGKTMLLRQIASQSECDVVVMGLIGERGSEARELLEHPPHERTVIVVATSDRPAMERARGAQAATAIAEDYRSRGMNVLLVIDSLTRYAMALREIGLAAGEAPATKGYPPSVFAHLPQLVERACPTTNGGSITCFYTVLVEGDDMADPVADSARSLLDGHIVLSRTMAAGGHFPAIDVLASASRVALQVTDLSQQRLAQKARRILTTVREVEELKSLGAYLQGANPEFDRALELGQKISEWSQQGYDEHSPLGTALAGLTAACAERGRR